MNVHWKYPVVAALLLSAWGCDKKTGMDHKAPPPATVQNAVRETDLTRVILTAEAESRLGIQTYGFLPMQLPAEFDFVQTIHAADERIPLEALDFGARAIYKVMQRFGS